MPLITPPVSRLCQIMVSQLSWNSKKNMTTRTANAGDGVDRGNGVDWVNGLTGIDVGDRMTGRRGDGGDWGGKGEVKKLWEEKKVKKEKKCNQGGTNKER